jgi:hypothetical protein
MVTGALFKKVFLALEINCCSMRLYTKRTWANVKNRVQGSPGVKHRVILISFLLTLPDSVFPASLLLPLELLATPGTVMSTPATHSMEERLQNVQLCLPPLTPTDVSVISCACTELRDMRVSRHDHSISFELGKSPVAAT